MKNVLFALLVVAISAFAFVACGGDGNIKCEAYGQTVGNCTNIKACCEGAVSSSVQCWYESGSQKWNCDGSNCEAAALQMTTDCNAGN